MNNITNRQMVMLLIITLTCYTIIVIPKDMVMSAGTGGWLSIIVMALIFGLAAVMIVSLNSIFPGRTLLEYAPQLVGRPIAYSIVIYYVLYFMFIMVFLITMKAKLLKADFFPDTPIWAFPMIGVPVFCFIANKGITNAGRLAELVGLVFIVSALFVHILMITQGKVSRVLPLFNSADMKSYFSSIKNAIFPFLGIEVLLAIPLTKANKKIKRTVFLTILSIGLFYILIVESCIMIVGINDIVNYDDPLIVAIRDTAPEFLDIFARLDILYLTIGFGSIFVGISIVMAVIVEYLCKLFKKVNRKIIVLAVGVVAYIQFMIFKDIPKYDKFVTQVGTYLGIVSAILIPCVLLLLAKKKKKKVKGKKDAV